MSIKILKILLLLMIIALLVWIAIAAEKKHAASANPGLWNRA
jgi:nitric oxide reductase large subunit